MDYPPDYLRDYIGDYLRDYPRGVRVVLRGDYLLSAPKSIRVKPSKLRFLAAYASRTPGETARSIASRAQIGRATYFRYLNDPGVIKMVREIENSMDIRTRETIRHEVEKREKRIETARILKAREQRESARLAKLEKDRSDRARSKSLSPETLGTIPGSASDVFTLDVFTLD